LPIAVDVELAPLNQMPLFVKLRIVLLLIVATALAATSTGYTAHSINA
jgi:hypothetical protein